MTDEFFEQACQKLAPIYGTKYYNFKGRYAVKRVRLKKKYYLITQKYFLGSLLTKGKFFPMEILKALNDEGVDITKICLP